MAGRTCGHRTRVEKRSDRRQEVEGKWREEEVKENKKKKKEVKMPKGNGVTVSKDVYIAFDGTEADWDAYETRIKTVAAEKKWKEALGEKDNNTTQAEYDEMNDKAMKYLSMSLSGDAFLCYSIHDKAKDVWKELLKIYGGGQRAI